VRLITFGHGTAGAERIAELLQSAGVMALIDVRIAPGSRRNPYVARAELERAIARVSQGRGVLLLTDMFGGAPTDIASMFLDDEAIEVVTGVNLPMILKLADQSADSSLALVASRVRDAGKEGIQLAGELLTPPAKTA